MIRALKFTQKGDLVLYKGYKFSKTLNLKALKLAREVLYAEFK